MLLFSQVLRLFHFDVSVCTLSEMQGAYVLDLGLIAREARWFGWLSALERVTSPLGEEIK